MLELAGFTSKGVLETNDDRFVVNKEVIDDGIYECEFEKECLAFVCDGVGGEKYGYVAASIASEVFSEIINYSITPELVRVTVEKANSAIIKKQVSDLRYSGMATTLAGIFISGDDFLLFNVGDSRVYRFRPPYISVISMDHSLIAENERAGLDISDSQRHVITRYLGGKCWEPYILEQREAIGDKDIFVMCTDGIWDYVSEYQFEKILNRNISCKQMCDEIISLSNKNGTDDNHSIIIIRRK